MEALIINGACSSEGITKLTNHRKYPEYINMQGVRAPWYNMASVAVTFTALQMPRRGICSSSSSSLGVGGGASQRRNLHWHKWAAACSSSPDSKPSKATTAKAQAEETPEWAKPGSDVPPPWASSEGGGVKSASPEGFQDFPFFVYLIASSLVAIAAVGSVFEYINKNPIFGVVQPDSPFYTPILGFFSITGLPVAAFLWFRAINLANKESEKQDKEDGYL